MAESSGCLLLGTTATGLEECLVKEIRCKIPSAVVLGVPGDRPPPPPAHVATGDADLSIAGAGRVFFWMSWARDDAEADALEPLSELFAVEKLFVVVGRGALSGRAATEAAPEAAVMAEAARAQAAEAEQSSGQKPDLGASGQSPLVCGVAAWLVGLRVWQRTARMRQAHPGAKTGRTGDGGGTASEAAAEAEAQDDGCPRFQIVKRYRKGGSDPKKQRQVLELAAALESTLGWRSTTEGDHELEVHVRPSSASVGVGARPAGAAGAEAGGQASADNVWLMLALTTEPVSWRGRLVPRGREHSVTTLRQSVAYALGSLAGLGERSAGEVCIDPMCGSGTVVEVLAMRRA